MWEGSEINGKLPDLRKSAIFDIKTIKVISGLIS